MSENYWVHQLYNLFIDEIFALPFDKTDVKHTGVEIIIAATNDLTCPVSALRELFMLNPQPSNAPLFSLDDGTAFARNPVIQIFHQRLQASGIPYQSYSGHSFRKIQPNMLPTTVRLTNTFKSWADDLLRPSNFTSKHLLHHYTASIFVFRQAVLQLSTFSLFLPSSLPKPNSHHLPSLPHLFHLGTVTMAAYASMHTMPYILCTGCWN